MVGFFFLKKLFLNLLWLFCVLKFVLHDRRDFGYGMWMSEGYFSVLLSLEPFLVV